MARLIRNANVVIREVDDVIFLVGPGNDAIFHLNQTGAAVWRLLAEPVSIEEAVRLLSSAFPNVPSDQISDDVQKLVDELDRRDFLIWLD